ncbi:DinB family protein [Flagellimonas allohymeniacidonis]|uniref:DinB family protein n=1 Tax=Flagellimonas allohymeniacidonis TaxID=2517819 RepID=A0A4Q8QKR4_9FLAO|nr:DinB family protein [Allomuricauda hymeniacidonis]TAI48836.1 DinB family protein [Allomuricauda hymeniacidonis]
MIFELHQAISILERTPGVLKSLLFDVGEEWSTANEGRDSWSPFDVVGHLIHGENTDWLVRTQHILEHGPEIPFEPYDRFAQFENSKGKNFEDLLNEFEMLRAKNIKTLKSLNLTNDDFERKGMHPGLGEVTLSQLLSAWVVHDLGHIAQISRVLAKHYKNEVGPWTQYLTILNFTPKE